MYESVPVCKLKKKKTFFLPAKKVEPAEQSSKINAIDSKRQANLDYLLKQAELYTHFVTNGSKLKNNKRKSITTSTNP